MLIIVFLSSKLIIEKFVLKDKNTEVDSDDDDQSSPAASRKVSFTCSRDREDCPL